MKKTIVAALLAGALAMTACGGKTTEPAAEAPAEETAAEETTEETTEETAEEPEKESTGVVDAPSAIVLENEAESADGIVTVRVPAGSSVEGFAWGLYQGDKGDASLTELVTDSTQEEGFDYVASFKAVDGASDGADYIRIAYANGEVTLAYFDVHVEVEGGALNDNVVIDPAVVGYDSAYVASLEGTWAEENDGAGSVTVTKSADGIYEVVLTKDTGKDGKITLTTMHAYTDAAQDCLVYTDGAEQEAEITEGEGEAAVIGGGTATGRFYVDMADEANVKLTWMDTATGESLTFVQK